MDEVILVEESDTIRACHRMAASGFLFGGSTGTVVSGAVSWLKKRGATGLTAVTISPDLGERYLHSIYQRSWVNENYGNVLDSSRRSDRRRDRQEVGIGKLSEPHVPAAGAAQTAASAGNGSRVGDTVRSAES